MADANNHCIREISLVGSNWVTTTIAGLAGSATFADGTGNAARFFSISILKLDGMGNLYVQDYNPSYGGDCIRKITPVGTNWVVNTIYYLGGNTSVAGWAIDPSGIFYGFKLCNH